MGGGEQGVSVIIVVLTCAYEKPSLRSSLFFLLPYVFLSIYLSIVESSMLLLGSHACRVGQQPPYCSWRSSLLFPDQSPTTERAFLFLLSH